MPNGVLTARLRCFPAVLFWFAKQRVCSEHGFSPKFLTMRSDWKCKIVGEKHKNTTALHDCARFEKKWRDQMARSKTRRFCAKTRFGVLDGGSHWENYNGFDSQKINPQIRFSFLRATKIRFFFCGPLKKEQPVFYFASNLNPGDGLHIFCKPPFMTQSREPRSLTF